MIALNGVVRVLLAGYPGELPHISFPTAEELGSIAEALRLGPDGAAIDLVCGASGPGS